MIADLNQPTKNWLADHLDNFIVLLNEGEDPSCVIKMDCIEIEIRLNKLPGAFDRETLNLTSINHENN